MTIILTTDELERVTGYKTPKRQGKNSTANGSTAPDPPQPATTPPAQQR